MSSHIRLLALAVLSVSAAAAHAESNSDSVSIYGYIGVAIDSASATGGSSSKPRYTRLSDANSRIGFKGFEDLGNGSKAIWQVESSLRDVTQGGSNDWGQTATLASRNSFVGLDNRDWGRLIAGYNDTAYKTLVGSVSDFGIDVMGNTAADTWGTGPGYYQIFSRGETRLKNSVHYTSPLLGPVQLAASWGVDETQTNGSNKTRLDLAAKYSNGPFKLGLGWDHQNDVAGYAGGAYGSAATAPGKSIDYYKLIAAWQFSTGTLLGAGIEQGRYDATSGGSRMRQTAWTVAVSQSVNERLALKASWNELGALHNTTLDQADDFKAHQWVVGATYALSRKTSLFSYYSVIHNGAAQNVNLGFSPVVTGSNASDTVVLADGSCVRVLGIGLGTAF
ncbi:porin [Aquitalea denitrificans]|uniref:porin n=1 Tax=Aquitalea denitrificans TaxID=519081 RepID=UPI00135695C2|nr:porin [Aquitalea denitrificans]